MRSFLLFFMLMSLFALASCSGSKTSAQLKISSSFLTSNTSFDGGLLIYGKETTTLATFTVGITSGNTANITIPFGNYDVRVVGWDNNSPVLFEGAILCDETNFNFTSEGQQLTVSVNTAKCVDNDIAGFNYRISGGPDFKRLVVQTCGALYDLTNPTNFSSDLTNANFCSFYPIELQKTAPKFKVVYLNQSASQAATPGITSECLSAQTLNLKKIPSKFPIKIELYKDNLCATLMKNFDFPSGYETGNANFDSPLGDDSTYAYLKLSTADHKRGLTPFITESPLFKCDDATTGLFNCFKIMNPTGANTPYVLDVGPYQRIKLPNESTSCATTAASFSPTTGSPQMEVGSCVNHNGHTYIRVRSAVSGSAAFVFDSNTYQLTFGNSATVYGTADKAKTRKLYQTLKTLLGSSTTPGTHDLALQDDYLNDGRNHYGVFSPVREILSPFGVGGLFFDQTCSDTPMPAGITRTMNYTNVGGTVMAVEAILKNSPLTIPPHYIYNNSGPQATTPHVSPNYDRRIIIREMIVPGNYETRKVLDIDCDAATLTTGNFLDSGERRIGRYEEQSVTIDGSKTFTNKNILHWNTTLAATGRFDYHKFHKYEYSGTTQHEVRGYYRGEKSPGTANSLYRITAMEYDATRDGSQFDEVLSRFEIDAQWDQPSNTSNMTYSFKDLGTLKKENGTLETIFSLNLFAHVKNETLFNYQFGMEKNKQSALKTLPNGKYIHAYASGTNLKTSFYSGSAYDSQSLTSINPLELDADISENGNLGIVVSHVGTNIRIDRHNGGWMAPQFVSLSAAGIANIKDLEVVILDSGNYLIGVIDADNDENLFFAHTASFATVPAGFSTSNGGTDEILEFDMTRSATKMYVAYSLNENMGGHSYVGFCEFDEATPECAQTAVESTMFSSGVYSDIGIQILGPSIYINYHNINGNNVSADSLMSPTPTVFTTTAVSGSSFNYTGWGPYSFTTYYTTQLNWNAPWSGHAHAPTPFVQPVLNQSHNFKMNFKSLESSTVNALYTAGFIGVVN